jgi:phosphatidylserine decarboxylase
MTTRPHAVDVRRRAGWLPENQLGYFQYGGSTHCLAFRPGAIAEFVLAAIPQPHDPKAPLMLVRSKLATASTAA